MKASIFRSIVRASGLGLFAIVALAQDRPPTTEQLGKDPGARRQEAEQQRARESERQQRSDQQQRDQEWNDTLRQQQGRAAADQAQGQAVLRSWQQRPPLAPEQNPLLGRWESVGAGRRQSPPGCVFRKSVTGVFGIVTDGFGNVTGHFGDVTDGLSSVF